MNTHKITLKQKYLDKKHSQQLVYKLFGSALALIYTLCAFGLPFGAKIALWITALCLFIVFVPRTMKYHAGLLFLMIGIMSFIPIGVDTEFWTGAPMIIGMLVALSVPFIAMKYIKKEDFMHFRLNLRHVPTRKESRYIIIAVVVVIFWLSIFMFTTDAAKHWHTGTFYDATVTFLAIMGIGVWEELFFIGAVFGILRQYLTYRWANAFQAIMFSAFLWQVGFKGWIYLLLLCYAYYQGMVYVKTKNLSITLIIHALVDLIVFISIVLAMNMQHLPH